MAIKYGDAKLSGQSGLSATGMERTALHRVLMRLARTHLAEAEAAQRGEDPLGDVAAFALLAHCAFQLFLASTWTDVPTARTQELEGKWTKAKAEKRRWRVELPPLLEGIDKGADGKQAIDPKDLRAIEAFIYKRNTLLQHSPQEFEEAGPQTAVRTTFTVEYGEEVWEHLSNAIRALSQKYGLDASWLDRC